MSSLYNQQNEQIRQSIGQHIYNRSRNQKQGIKYRYQTFSLQQKLSISQLELRSAKNSMSKQTCAAKRSKQLQKVNSFTQTSQKILQQIILISFLYFGQVIYNDAQAIQTVSPEQATQQAKPIAKQKVDKVQTWIFFIGTSGGLYLAMLYLETNKKFFPTIAKAQELLTAYKKDQQENDAKLKKVQMERDQLYKEQQYDDRLTKAVSEELQQKREEKLIGEASDPQSQQQQSENFQSQTDESKNIKEAQEQSINS